MTKMIFLGLLALGMTACHHASLTTVRPQTAAPVSPDQFTAPSPAKLGTTSPAAATETPGSNPNYIRPIDPSATPATATAANKPAPGNAAVPAKPKPAANAQPAAPAPPIDRTETCAENKPCRHVPAVAAMCDAPKGLQTVALNTKQVDFVFIVDTSASIVKGPIGGAQSGYLRSIAEQMPALINSIDPGTDANIAVVLAHGPRSPWFGKLFTFGAGDRAVLKSKEMNREQMWTALKNKLMHVPDDKSDAEGEAVMLATYKSLKDNFVSLQNAGLFRKDTNTIFIAITDEQDVCWSYPNMKNPLYQDVVTMVPDQAAFLRGDVPVLKPLKLKKGAIGPDPAEVHFFSHTCSHYVGGHPSADGKGYEGGRLLVPADVVQMLHGVEAQTGAKVFYSGIVHKDNVGLGAYVDDEDENEMAHGTLDVIEQMHGTLEGHVIDFKDVIRTGANVDFTRQLGILGSTARQNMKVSGVFNCGTSQAKIHPNAIDLSQIGLEVLDEKSNVVATYSGQCPTSGPCQKGDGGIIAKPIQASGHIYLQVSPADQNAFSNLINAKKVNQITYRIKFLTKPDYDLSTGEPFSAPLK